MDVSSRITDLREKKGYSVNKLANLAGISQGFLREIELGEKNLTVKSLNSICSALDITLQEFFIVDSETQLQNKLINVTKKLTPDQLEYLIKFIESL